MENQEDKKEPETLFDINIRGIVKKNNSNHSIEIENVNISGDITLGHFIMIMQMFHSQSLKWANNSVIEKSKNDMRNYDDLLQEMYLMKMEDFIKEYLNKKDGNDKGE